VEVAATAIGLLGAAGVLLFVVMLLRPYELGFSGCLGRLAVRPPLR
jgi:hypothetical protein